MVRRLSCLTFGWMVALVGGGPIPALAGGSVNACDPASLKAAMAGGGLVTFACDGTVRLTETLEVDADTVIEGAGHSIVLSGGGEVRLFAVRNGVSLELRNLSLIEGRHAVKDMASTLSGAEGTGGAVHLDGPTAHLRAERCRFAHNEAQGGYTDQDGGNGGAGQGGAVRVRGGRAEFVDCVFEANRALGGPATRPDTTFLAVYGSGLGGAIHADTGSALRFDGCRFLTNSASGQRSLSTTSGAGGNAFGGAVSVAGGTLEVAGCLFQGNSATPGTAPRSNLPGRSAGGSLYLTAPVTAASIVTSHFEGNVANGGTALPVGQPVAGGAISTAAALRCERSRFLANRAQHGFLGSASGGAIATTGALHLEECGFSENTAQGGAGGGPAGMDAFQGLGGALFLGAAGTIVDCAFDGNVASGGEGNSIPGQPFSHGADGLGGAIHASAALAMTNVTLYRNEARGGSADPFGSRNPGVGRGGGLHVSREFHGIHLTLAGNRAIRGGSEPAPGTGGGVHLTGTAMARLLNSLIADSPQGNNCAGAFTESTRNLSSDTSCGFAAGGGWDGTPPGLGPYQIEGGSTATLSLAEDSPAIDAGDPDACPPLDQRGAVRPSGTGCDLGAFERTRTVSLSGRVVGLPPGVRARVTAGRTSGLAATNGTYVLPTVPPGAIEVTLEADGYRFLPPGIRLDLTEDRVLPAVTAHPIHVLLLEATPAPGWLLRFGAVENTGWILEQSADLRQWTEVSAHRVDAVGWIETAVPRAEPVAGAPGTAAFRMRRP
jgi:hypothetical protein